MTSMLPRMAGAIGVGSSIIGSRVLGRLVLHLHCFCKTTREVAFIGGEAINRPVDGGGLA